MRALQVVKVATKESELSVAFTRKAVPKLRRKFCYPTVRFHLIRTLLRKRD
jgi:hypothetical protein